MNAQILNKSIALRHELHRHPELSGEEVWTKQYLINFFKEETDLEIIDHGHYFYAKYQGSSNEEAIAFRAEMDALPIADEIDTPYRSQIEGRGHKCGHDGHMASLCALALEVERSQPERTVIFLFQPAEETGQGAKECLGVFEEQNISEFYAYHNLPGEPEQVIAIKNDTIALTSKGLNLYFKGRTSHASYPEDGLNPAFAMARVVRWIEKLQEDPSDFEGLVRCTLVHLEVGEAAFGVSAGSGVLRLTIRAELDEELEKLENNLVKISREASQEAGLGFYYDDQEYFPASINDGQAVKKVWAVAEKNNMEIKELTETFRASEDFAYFLQKVKGALVFIGDGLDHPPLHTIEFDFPDENIPVAVKLFMGLIEGEEL